MKTKDIENLEKNFNKIANLLKIIIGILIIICVVTIFGLSRLYSSNSNYSSSNTDSQDNSTSTDNGESEEPADYDVSMFEEITASDIKSKTNKSKQVIYVGRSTCSWCIKFLPNLQKAQEEYGYKTLYIDIAKIIDFSSSAIIDQSAYNTMTALTGDDYEDYMDEEFGATPMVLIVEKGKIIGAQTGYSEYDDFVKVLEDAGFKK